MFVPTLASPPAGFLAVSGFASNLRKGAQTKNAAKPPRRSDVHLPFKAGDCQYVGRMGVDLLKF
ncbi:hypothetical protein D1O30_15085 [Methylocystis hirsuta]|uniref:Uncharacterized protein n=1 Tax=Methylocystis hirsuta TaxID=369798 RepID=A0A3M9XV04_9HYPH|nr:hypothetical protein D1O30_15085 [Methylocystis hirsuta]